MDKRIIDKKDQTMVQQRLHRLTLDKVERKFIRILQQKVPEYKLLDPDQVAHVELKQRLFDRVKERTMGQKLSLVEIIHIRLYLSYRSLILRLYLISVKFSSLLQHHKRGS